LPDVAAVVIFDFNYWIASCEIPGILNNYLFIYLVDALPSLPSKETCCKGRWLTEWTMVSYSRGGFIFFDIYMRQRASSVGHYVNNSGHAGAIISRILRRRVRRKFIHKHLLHISTDFNDRRCKVCVVAVVVRLREEIAAYRHFASLIRSFFGACRNIPDK